jgi:RimJ/RimL family protein N-acetyltransferase
VSQEKRFTILESERLQLRYQQAADVEALVDLWSDPEVTRYLGGPRDRAWLQSVFEETAAAPYAEAYDLWPVIEKETGRLVGHAGLLKKEVAGRAEIELTYVLAASAWGQGYATVAAGRCTTIWGTSTIEHLAPTAPTVAHSVRAR